MKEGVSERRVLEECLSRHSPDLLQATVLERQVHQLLSNAKLGETERPRTQGHGQDGGIVEGRVALTGDRDARD